VEVFEFGERQAEFAAVVAGEREAQFGIQGAGQIVDFVAVDEDGAAAKDGLDDTAAGAAGKIAHNKNLERRIGLRGGIIATFTWLDIQHHTRIRIFWHLLSSCRQFSVSRCPILHGRSLE
jgi:hypothetical protein